MFTIETGSGFWNPLIWVGIVFIALLIAYVLRGLGKKEYKKDTEQVKPFLSGNVEPSKDLMHLRAKNLYWGFKEVLKGYYVIAKKMHNGAVGDYVLWFIVIMCILFIVLGVF
jgi:hypothetical protein